MSVYVPDHFAARDRATIARLVHDFPFATLVTPGSPEPHVSHLPLLHVADCEPLGTLVGHFARANPHADAFGATSESLAIFSGPHAYISPSWYRRLILLTPLGSIRYVVSQPPEALKTT